MRGDHPLTRRLAQAGSARRRFVVAALLGLVTCAAVASEMNVYVSYSKKGMPIFSDVPANSDARPVFTYRTPVTPPGLASMQAEGYAGPGGAIAFPERFAASRPPRSGPMPLEVLALVKQAAHRHGLDAALVMALIEVESRFQRDALSSAGAMGLMQLMPQTARRFGAVDPWNAQSNVDAGTKYLSYLLTLFRGDVKLALAGYNAGEGNVIAAGWRVPRFAETQRYVPAVLDRFKHWTVALQSAGAR